MAFPPYPVKRTIMNQRVLQRGQEVVSVFVLPLLLLALVLYVGDLFVPTEGWWILLKIFTSAKVPVFILGLLFLFWTLVMLLGSKTHWQVKNRSLPQFFIMLGAGFAVAGIFFALIEGVVGGENLSRLLTGLVLALAGVLFSWSAAFFILGMIDRDTGMRIGRSLFWLPPRPRDPGLN